jgi:hypothetical protein
MAVHPGSIWLDQNWGYLTPGIWVAANATGILAEHPDYDIMLSQLAARNISLSEVTIAIEPKGIVQ